MNILQIAIADNGGATWWFKVAIERHTRHECRAVRMVQNYLDYPYDILNPSEGEMGDLWDWADVVHIRDGLPLMARELPDKPTVITYTGNFYRRNYEVYHRRSNAKRRVITVSTVDLTTYHDQIPEWLPNPREDLSRLWDPHPHKFIVVHAPTNPATKSTAEIARAVEDLPVKLELIQQAPHAECMERKARGHVLVDQFRYGYGNNAVEAWALGIPVVGGFWGRLWHRALLRYCGDLPLALAKGTVESIRETIVRLRDDPAFYAETQERGREFFFEHHHAPVVARRAVEFYKQAMDSF